MAANWISLRIAVFLERKRRGCRTFSFHVSGICSRGRGQVPPTHDFSTQTGVGLEFYWGTGVEYFDRVWCVARLRGSKPRDL